MGEYASPSFDYSLSYLHILPLLFFSTGFFFKGDYRIVHHHNLCQSHLPYYASTRIHHVVLSSATFLPTFTPAYPLLSPLTPAAPHIAYITCCFSFIFCHFMRVCLPLYARLFVFVLLVVCSPPPPPAVVIDPFPYAYSCDLLEFI
jgi:hypothetical protein